MLRINGEKLIEKLERFSLTNANFKVQECEYFIVGDLGENLRKSIFGGEKYGSSIMIKHNRHIKDQKRFYMLYRSTYVGRARVEEIDPLEYSINLRKFRSQSYCLYECISKQEETRSRRGTAMHDELKRDNSSF